MLTTDVGSIIDYFFMTEAPKDDAVASLEDAAPGDTEHKDSSAHIDTPQSPEANVVIGDVNHTLTLHRIRLVLIRPLRQRSRLSPSLSMRVRIRQKKARIQKQLKMNMQI